MGLTEMRKNLAAGAWSTLAPSVDYTCAYCGYSVAETTGLSYHVPGAPPKMKGFLRYCHHCQCPTFISPGIGQVPSSLPGERVENVEENVLRVYDEARQCMSVGAYTAAAMMLRKILMHVGVDHKGNGGESFAYYVQYLLDQHLIPPTYKPWVDQLRTKGNELNHEIVMVSKEDAEDLLTFAAALLRTIYEYPAKARLPVASP